MIIAFTPRDTSLLSCGRGSGAIRSRIFLHPLASVRQDLSHERVQPDHVSVPVASRNGAPTDEHRPPDFQSKSAS